MDPPSEDIEVVSLDIFDTLILRPFAAPTDLFLLMEQERGCPGFRDARVKAERDARSEYRREITLDEIYDHLPASFDPESLKEAECRMETDLCYADPELMSWVSEIPEGKKVIIITDMYLPKDVIAGILDRNGIRYDRLYVSSEIGLTKHDGTLFQHVLNDMGIQPGRMVHIGDNPRADLRIPERLGIRTMFRESRISSYLRTHPDERRYLRKHHSLTSSIIVALDSVRGAHGDVWEDMGDRYGGPLAYSFAKHISDHHNPGSAVLFSSRDGYTLIKAFGMLNDERNVHYVHAPRLLSSMFSGHVSDIEVPSRFRDYIGYKRALYNMRLALAFYASDLGLESIPNNADQVISLYDGNRERIESARSLKFSQYSQHLSSIAGDDDVEIVDCTTMKMSSQKLIEKALGRRVRAHYLVVLRDSDQFEYDALCRWPFRFIGWERVDIPEFLLCSPEPPMSGWSDGPIYDDPPEWERVRCENYQKMSDSELAYVERMRRIFGEHLPSFDYMDVNRWVMLSTAKGTRYRELLSTIKWASSPDHSDWLPIIPWDAPIKSTRRLANQVASVISRKR